MPDLASLTVTVHLADYDAFCELFDAATGVVNVVAPSPAVDRLRKALGGVMEADTRGYARG